MLLRSVATAAAHDSGPFAFRYPRGAGNGVEMPERGEVLEIGKGRVIQEGTDVAFLSFGAHLAEVEAAARLLEKDGISVTIADARFAKPLDIDLILDLATNHKALITVEQGARGGFGAMVLHELTDRGAMDHGLKVRTMTLPDTFIYQDKPEKMYDQAKLNAPQIVVQAWSALGRSVEGVVGDNIRA